MTRAPRLLALLLLAIIFPAGATDARGTTVYVQRVFVADAGDVRLGDLVQARGDIGARGREALAQSVAVLADAPVYVPVALYRDRLEAAFGDDAIVVGSRSMVIPRGAVPDGEAFLLDRLADYLCAQGVLGDQKTELRFTQNLVTGIPPQEGSPVFSIRKSAADSIEASFSLGGVAGNSVTGRLTLPSSQGSLATPQTLRNGALVQVVFHKGLITIQMPGRIAGPVGAGEKVSVYVPDSQRTFSGRVIDGKAVSVDLP
jgi:Chaperone for flagella basal body P-ring formation